MTAPFSLTVTVDDATHTVTPTAGDLVKFERHFDMPAAAMDAAGGRVEHVLYIAWAAMVRTGRYARDFEVFVESVDMNQDAQTTANPPDVLPPPN